VLHHLKASPHIPVLLDSLRPYALRNIPSDALLFLRSSAEYYKV
jgi:hypothetical protein